MTDKATVTLAHSIMDDKEFGTLRLSMPEKVHFQLHHYPSGHSELTVFKPTVVSMRAMRDSLTEAITAFHLAGLGGDDD